MYNLGKLASAELQKDLLEEGKLPKDEILNLWYREFEARYKWMDEHFFVEGDRAYVIIDDEAAAKRKAELKKAAFQQP